MRISLSSRTRTLSNRCVWLLVAVVFSLSSPTLLSCLLSLQALEVIRVLRETIPIQRASMRLRLTLPAREARRVREKILPLLTVESENWESGDLDIVSSYGLFQCQYTPFW